MSFSEMLAVTERGTLQFFFSELRDISGEDADQRELLYTASVLAHHALVSTSSNEGTPSPQSLLWVLDNFVLSSDLYDDTLMMETAGAQCLLLTGFFASQMRRRHNVKWYSDLGGVFFRRAALLSNEQKRAELLQSVGDHFEPWRVRFARLHDELVVRPYLINARKE